MADSDTMHTMEKIYCMPYNNGNDNNTQLLAELMNAKNQGTDAATMAALFSRNNDGWQNNPFMYLIWLAFFGNGGNGFGWGGNNNGENYNSRQIAALQDTVNTNHNNDLAMQAINGNRDAIGTLATALNTDFNSMQTAVCGVKNAIEQVSGQLGWTGESVKNAIALGDRDIIQQICNTGCGTQKEIIKMGYESQLANERQTNILGSQIADFRSADQLQTCQQTNLLQGSIADVRSTIINGFAQTGYATQAQTDAIVRAGQENTQRLMDFINNHWVAESSQQLQDAKGEISQLKQSVYLGNLITGNGGNGVGGLW